MVSSSDESTVGGKNGAGGEWTIAVGCGMLCPISSKSAAPRSQDNVCLGQTHFSADSFFKHLSFFPQMFPSCLDVSAFLPTEQPCEHWETCDISIIF